MAPLCLKLGYWRVPSILLKQLVWNARFVVKNDPVRIVNANFYLGTPVISWLESTGMVTCTQCCVILKIVPFLVHFLWKSWKSPLTSMVLIQFFKVKIDKLFTWVPSIILACMVRYLTNFSPCHAVLITYYFSQCWCDWKPQYLGRTIWTESCVLQVYMDHASKMITWSGIGGENLNFRAPM